MTTFRTMVVNGVPAVEILDGDGQRMGIIYAEDDGSVEVMSDSWDGPFYDSVEFKHAELTLEKRLAPRVVMKFRVSGAKIAPCADRNNAVNTQ